MEPRIILASASPRRQALLSELGVHFAIESADIDERPQTGETPDDMVRRLSRAKASAIAARHELGTLVLAADTVVALNGTVLGKPGNLVEAAQMLRTLRGRAHDVYTAVSLAHDRKLLTRLSHSVVYMRDYDDTEIERYVATGDPLDKAGAYAIQHPVFSPVENWEGSYTSIMGLPLPLVVELLSNAGVVVPVALAEICEKVRGRRLAAGPRAEC